MLAASARIVAVLVLLAVTVGLLWLRDFVSPKSAGYRVAIAAAEGGDAYLASPRLGLVRLRATGAVEKAGALPAGKPLSLAASGSSLLLGDEDGLWSSTDGGHSWHPAGPSGRHWLTVANGPGGWIAGSWADRLWLRSPGQPWREVRVPAGDSEFESAVPGGGSLVVATVLGLLRGDAAALSPVPGLPDRVTALSADGSSILAGDWRGNVYGSTDGGGSWSRRWNLGHGVWALDARTGLVATTGGLYREGARMGGAVAGKEITAVVSSGDRVYVTVARGPVLASGDLGRSWANVVEP